ncbi:hypothetical protein [Salipiger sp. PrR003]|uniref:hypothetical protein n=1 Tax=Salipiger sp. PrR003 TaxID=2706776 RepID=UPI0013D9A348|nr:hypothetical protein [Salipiger sp. PrR003]NDV51477.1 hypothetical protein [Salipiger sp. PrR003]
MSFRLLAIGAVSAITLAGCDTYTAQQYQSSPQNVIALQQIAAQGNRASVGTVSLAAGIEPRPTCRLAGPLDLGGGDNVAATIKQAIQAEFLEAGIFSVNAVPVNFTITRLVPNSMEGSWEIGIRASSQRNAGYEVVSTTPFSTSFTAMAACNNTATAFNRALSMSINEVVTDPRFRSLL